jgi:tRNA (uracil-5-)-methyltransferase
MGRSKGTRILLDRDYVVETQTIGERSFTQKQPEGTFSQPNGTVCMKMITWASQQTKGSTGDLLELYCGNGNFTIPLAANFGQVVATEVRHLACRFDASS